MLSVVLEEVEAQRSRSTSPEDLPEADLSCDRMLAEFPRLSLTGQGADIVRLFSCWQPSASKTGEWKEAVVRLHDVRVLARDFTRHASTALDPAELRCIGGVRKHYAQYLIAQTVWGDVLVIHGECRRFLAVDQLADVAMVWHPSPDSQRILDDLRR